MTADAVLEMPPVPLGTEAAPTYGRFMRRVFDMRGTGWAANLLITLDWCVSDPDGSDATPTGGWAFRYGPEAVAGDEFRLGRRFDEGVLVLGRKTWELFSRIWPGRDDPFSTRMNAVPKLVATRTLDDTTAWPNSAILEGDLIDAVNANGAMSSTPSWVSTRSTNTGS